MVHHCTGNNPFLVLARGWQLAHQARTVGAATWFALAVSTLSYLLLIAEIWFPETWG